MNFNFGFDRPRMFHTGLITRTAVALGCALAGLPPIAIAQGPQIHWQDQHSPDTPADGAVVGGPGDAPEHNSPLYVCRAAYQGSTQPGKWVKGNCNVTYNSREVVVRDYQVLYGATEWRPYTGNPAGLLQTGNDADGAPIYSCRVQYHNHGYQPGKIYGDKCDIPYDGGEKGQHGPFEALYVAGSSSYVAMQSGPGSSGGKSGGVWGKLIANAQYQQSRQNGNDSRDSLAPLNSQRRTHGGSNSGDLPPCRSEDPNAHLENGKWVGPNCLTEPDDGHYVTDEEAKKQNEDLRNQRSARASQGDQEKRAADMESHSCMTTDGADKANELAADCQKVADHPDKACNIQQNSCDEIRKATQKGCWGKGAEGPDWCLTKYN